jgi:endonuclease/exonuclease/phosphatase family metal-dependent hydrolase
MLVHMKTPYHKLAHALIFFIILLCGKAWAQGNSFAIASFNLGWWPDKPTFIKMIEVCNAATPAWCDPRKDTADSVCKLSLPEGVPPCNAYTEYQRLGTQTLSILAPSPTYWDAKRSALRSTAARTNADIFALEEVSGIAAAMSVIGSANDPYHFCESALRDASKPEAQRLVIAARKSVFTQLQCRNDEALRVSDAGGRYTRPALIGELQTTNGKSVKVIVLHLKSSCASPIGDEQFSFSGDLLTSTNNTNCPTLRAQVAPLERLIEREVTAGQNVIMLGDFNRKIHLEMHKDAGPARENGADGKGIPLPNDRVRLLWPEVNDREPLASELHILPREAKTTGCSGFDGLDHITVSSTLRQANPNSRSEDVPLSNFGGNVFPASDHCPLRTRLVLP